MIANDHQLDVTLQRIAKFQQQIAQLRKTESNPANYYGSVSGYLAEIDRMQFQVREYLSIHPAEFAQSKDGIGGM